MTTDTPPPRRKWHFNRWLIVLTAAALGWGGWEAYAFRSALAEAKALGWAVQYTDPAEEIRANWKAAFKKETWLDGVTRVYIRTGEEFEQNLAIVHRLNPLSLGIDKAPSLRDLSALEALTRLQVISIFGGGTHLTNVDALKNFSALQRIYLVDCTGLTNLPPLKNLSALQAVYLVGCTGLTDLDAFKDISALKLVDLRNCTGLTNLDGLRNHSALEVADIRGCTGLPNVNVLMNLSALQSIWLHRCTGLTKESVAALKAALPKATIHSDYK